MDNFHNEHNGNSSHYGHNDYYLHYAHYRYNHILEKLTESGKWPYFSRDTFTFRKSNSCWKKTFLESRIPYHVWTDTHIMKSYLISYRNTKPTYNLNRHEHDLSKYCILTCILSLDVSEKTKKDFRQVLSF